MLERIKLKGYISSLDAVLAQLVERLLATPKPQNPKGRLQKGLNKESWSMQDTLKVLLGVKALPISRLEVDLILLGRFFL